MDETVQQIEQNLADLRHAVEDRRYDDVPAILQCQRALFDTLDFKKPESFDLLKEAQDLTHWAVTLVRLQHAHTERAYACMQRLKQMDEGYTPSPVCTADLVDLFA